MITALNIVIIGLLLGVAVEDIRSKEVSLIFLLGLILLGGFVHFYHQEAMLFWVYTGTNLLLLSFILGLLYLYAKLKLKQSLLSGLGSGDILFFIFLAVSFSPTVFLVLYVGSLLLSLGISFVLKPDKNKIPLAGYQSIFMILFLIANTLFKYVNPYQI